MVAARYDLGTQSHLATFDFFTWLVVVQSRGATEIVLGNIKSPHYKYSDRGELGRRVDSIIKPGCAFAGLPWREGDDGAMLYDKISMTDIPENFQRLKTVQPPREVRYTVTIRNQFFKPIRNSDQGVWRDFARRIGAYVIEDWNVRKIDLHKRMALYAGAKMNFGVVNGPIAMLMLTDYPYMMCNCMRKVKGFPQHGIEIGGQFRLARSNQILSWDKNVTADDLMQKFGTLPDV